MNPNRLRSLYELLEFNANSFISLQAELARVELALAHPKADPSAWIDAEMKAGLDLAMHHVSDECLSLQLLFSIDQIGRIRDRIKKPARFEEIAHLLGELRNRMLDELKGRVNLSITEAEAAIYRDPYPFGEPVASKFPRAAYDIVEASKCLALERSTAAVFHLMRVMELGVQSIGKKLGVSLTQDKTWQKILDDLNAPIKALPEKTRTQKRKKEHYSAAHSHLFNVKLAWRNRVMHPKATYTLEEARDIFNVVKTFTVYLIAEL